MHFAHRVTNVWTRPPCPAKFEVAGLNRSKLHTVQCVIQLYTNQSNQQVCGCSRLQPRLHEDCALTEYRMHLIQWKKNQRSSNQTNYNHYCNTTIHHTQRQQHQRLFKLMLFTSSSSSSRTSPRLERSRFHELPPSFSVLAKSPCWVKSVVERMEVCV